MLEFVSKISNSLRTGLEIRNVKTFESGLVASYVKQIGNNFISPSVPAL